MSNLIKTEAHVQGSPSESQAYRDLQRSKDQQGCGRCTFCRSVSAVPGKAGKWCFLQGKAKKTKAQASKMPVLHASYLWKLEAVREGFGNTQTGLHLTLVFMACVFCKLFNSCFSFLVCKMLITFFHCLGAIRVIQDNDCKTLDTVLRTRLFWMSSNVGINFAVP